MHFIFITMELTNPDKLVKVDLSWDIKVNLPFVEKDGTLGFYETSVFGDNGESLEVLLPEEVVNDRQTLTNYLREQHEYSGDLPSYRGINIWDKNESNPKKGSFRFDWKW